jgi:hypothetical protein
MAAKITSDARKSRACIAIRPPVVVTAAKLNRNGAKGYSRSIFGSVWWEFPNWEKFGEISVLGGLGRTGSELTLTESVAV